MLGEGNYHMTCFHAQQTIELPEGLPTKDDAEKAILVAETAFAITIKLISSSAQ